MAIDTNIQQRSHLFSMGFVGATVITLSLVLAYVFHQSSQRWGRFGGPFGYAEWFSMSLLLVVVSAGLAFAAISVPRLAVGLVVGTLTGVLLSFIVTAFYFKYQTDSYLINRPECTGNAHPTGSASCLDRRTSPVLTDSDVMLGGLVHGS